MRITLKRNKFASQCRDCGSLCPPDAGFLYERQDGYWKIRCDRCEAEKRKRDAEDEAKRISSGTRLEQRKAAWAQFRKPISPPDADGYLDRPPFRDFLKIWKKCAGFNDDFRQQMATYREAFAATATLRAEARAEAKRKWEKEREESLRKWAEGREERKRQARAEMDRFSRDHPAEFQAINDWHRQSFGWDVTPEIWDSTLSLWKVIQGLEARYGRWCPPRPDDCLKALGLSPPVTVDQVKSAFRAKCKEVHPDHGGDADAFVALRANYEKALAYAAAI